MVYVSLYTPGYTTVHTLHLGPAHPAAHDGRVRSDKALGSDLRLILGKRGMRRREPSIL